MVQNSRRYGSSTSARTSSRYCGSSSSRLTLQRVAPGRPTRTEKALLRIASARAPIEVSPTARLKIANSSPAARAWSSPPSKDTGFQVSRHAGSAGRKLMTCLARPAGTSGSSQSRNNSASAPSTQMPRPFSRSSRISRRPIVVFPKPDLPRIRRPFRRSAPGRSAVVPNLVRPTSTPGVSARAAARAWRGGLPAAR